MAYPPFPVGPDASGGAEQILFLLEREIVHSGRRSQVIAASRSTIAGQLIPSSAPSEYLAAIEQSLRQHAIDLIHFHGFDFHSYIPETDVPMLATLHLPLAWYPKFALLQRRVKLVCVSQSQAAGSRFPVVLNGVDISRFGRAPKQNFLLWLGRICPEKGVHIALEAARAADLPLLIVGPVHAFEAHRAYFREAVQPLLDEKRQYLGAVGGEEKNRLLAQARCLLIPSLVAETSSLVAMEAISSGTPVIAFANGALPEVVEHGTTGFIVDSQAAMAEAVGKVDAISPDVCRAVAERRFDAGRMARDYFKLYG